jgi:imidazole glycerol-phosphate synthase subunit HisF
VFIPRVIPVLLLRDKGLVKTIQFDKYKYIGDPINAVRIFNDLEADELIFLDIRASVENRTISVDLVKQIGDEAYMPFGVGGGISNLSDAMQLINAGAEKIIINTQFYFKPVLINSIAKVAGSQSVVVSIDVKKNWLGKYVVFLKSGKHKINISPLEYVKIAENEGAGEIIINSIDNEGRMKGYDLEIIKKIAEAVNIPVVACGGAGSLADFRNAIQAGAHAVAAGSMFVYHGRRNAVLVNYPEKEKLINTFN